MFKGLDFERFIDDFIFLCFFVGNDFLPTLPTLKIREGALETLMNIYRSIIHEGFLTDNGHIVVERVESFIKKLAENETRYFSTNKSNNKRKKKKDVKDIIWDEYMNIKGDNNFEIIELFDQIDAFFYNEDETVNNIIENVFISKKSAEDESIKYNKFSLALHNLKKASYFKLISSKQSL